MLQLPRLQRYPKRRATPAMTTFRVVIVLCCGILHADSWQTETTGDIFPQFTFVCTNSECKLNEKTYFNVTRVELLPADSSACAVNLSKSFSRDVELFFNVECAKDRPERRPIYNSTYDYGCTNQQPVTKVIVHYECTPAFANGSHISSSTRSDISSTASTYSMTHQSAITSEAQTLKNSSTAGDPAQVDDNTSVAEVAAAAVCSGVSCGVTILAIVLCHRRRLLCLTNLQPCGKHLSAAAAGPEPSDREFYDYATIDYNQYSMHYERLEQRKKTGPTMPSEEKEIRFDLASAPGIKLTQDSNVYASIGPIQTESNYSKLETISSPDSKE